MKIKTLSVAAGCLLFGTAAFAANIIDQNQPLFEAGIPMANFSQPNLAQSFQQANNNVSGAGIFLYNNGSGDNVTISLWDNLPNAGGNELASATAFGTPNNWVDVFWNPVSVTPGSELFLVFTEQNNNGGVAGSTSDPYPNGQVYANPGYQPFPTFDYTFRTYYSDNVTTRPVPEAGFTVTMLGMAIAGMGIIRRKLVS